MPDRNRRRGRDRQHACRAGRRARPARPTTRACRSRIRSRVRCCRRWTASRSGPRCRSSASSPWTSRSASSSPERKTAADVRTVAAFPVAAAQVRRWLAAHLPEAEIVAGQLERGCGRGRGARPRRRRGQHGAGRRTLRAGHPGLRGRRRAERPYPLRAGRSARTAARSAPAPTGRRWCCGSTTYPGALVSAMTEFAVRDIDLTRIESRPTRTELGTYVFFLDCVGHIDDTPVAEALKALHRRCADVRYLGSWPTGAPAGACRRRRTRRRGGWRDSGEGTR